MRLPFLTGRLLFGGYFLYNGINHFKNQTQLARYAGSKGVAGAGSGGRGDRGDAAGRRREHHGGHRAKVGAAAVIGVLAGISPIMHNFWKAEDPNQAMNDTINFTKNLALLGGTLALMSVTEPWPASVPLAQPHKLEGLRRELKQRLAA